jgi:protein-tyrosine phosphatase
MQRIIDGIREAFDARNHFHFENYYEYHRPESCRIAQLPEHITKNRGNFWGYPFDHNLITSIPHYINASPMEFSRFRYIAAQGPRSSTFSEFWQMAWAEEADLILTLTNEIEMWKGSLQMKFEKYWPEGSATNYGPFILCPIQEEIVQYWEDGRNEQIKKRVLEVQQERRKKQILHLQMENWPDGGVIHPESLVALGRWVDSLVSRPNPCIIVHCAAGVGRTGTFIAYHSLCRELLENQGLSSQGVCEAIIGRIKEMRGLRWGAMISHTDQYNLLLDALRANFKTHLPG